MQFQKFSCALYNLLLLYYCNIYFYNLSFWIWISLFCFWKNFYCNCLKETGLSLIGISHSCLWSFACCPDYISWATSAFDLLGTKPLKNCFIYLSFTFSFVRIWATTSPFVLNSFQLAWKQWFSITFFRSRLFVDFSKRVFKRDFVWWKI